MLLDQEFMVARKIFELANALITTRNEHIKNLHLTTGQADALMFFCDYPQSSISDLSNFEHIKHQSAQMITRRLVQKGYVKLKPNPADKRIKLVSLTNSGFKMREKLCKNGSRTGGKVLNTLSPSERKEFIALLETAINNLKEGKK